MSKKDISEKKVNNSEQTVVDFGKRTVSNQNFSKMIALPKTALANCGCDLDGDLKVDVQLVQQGNEKFLKIVPVCDKNTKKRRMCDV